jgi:hypothetical protein
MVPVTLISLLRRSINYIDTSLSQVAILGLFIIRDPFKNPLIRVGGPLI